MKTITIGILEPFVAPEKTATDVRDYALINYLKTNNYNVSVIYPRRNEYALFIRSRENRVKRYMSKISKRFDYDKEYWHWYADHILEKIRRTKYDVLLARGSIAGWLFTKKGINTLKILDIANVWYLEQYYGGTTKEKVSKIFEMEMKVYESADYIICHHDILKNFIKENVYDSAKLITSRMGCYETVKKAKYIEPVRFVYAGSNNYFNNPLLLAKLANILAVQIDCYGGYNPKLPFGPQRLNYKGYCENLDFLENYQFGLITASRDILRQHSPSTKFADYFSYGLPVFFPEWVKEGYEYEGCAVAYNEDNFRELVRRFSDRTTWEQMSSRAKAVAKDLIWDTTLKPIKDIIEAGVRC